MRLKPLNSFHQGHRTGSVTELVKFGWVSGFTLLSPLSGQMRQQKTTKVPHAVNTRPTPRRTRPRRSRGVLDVLGNGLREFLSRTFQVVTPSMLYFVLESDCVFFRMAKLWMSNWHLFCKILIRTNYTCHKYVRSRTNRKQHRKPYSI